MARSDETTRRAFSRSIVIGNGDSVRNRVQRLSMVPGGKDEDMDDNGESTEPPRVGKGRKGDGEPRSCGRNGAGGLRRKETRRRR